MESNCVSICKQLFSLSYISKYGINKCIYTKLLRITNQTAQPISQAFETEVSDVVVALKRKGAQNQESQIFEHFFNKWFMYFFLKFFSYWS